MEIKIETEKVLLRHIKMSDAEDIYEYATNPDVGPRAGWPPHKNIEETKGLIKMWLSPEATEEQFVLVYKQNNKVVGTMGITNLNEHTKDKHNTTVAELIASGKQTYEIGLTISKDYWDKSIGTETVRAMIKYLFTKRNADVVVATHFKANIASQRVQEKNNLKILQTYQRDDKWYNTDCTTMVVRGITKQEWQNSQERIN